MRNWMSFIADDTLLCDLMIPGTHDTMATTESDPENGAVSITQSDQLIDQLDKGIRFVDIRIRVHDSMLELHHGYDYLHEDFRNPLYICHRFLVENPTETIIMLINNNAGGNDSPPDPSEYENLLFDYIWAEDKQRSMKNADDRKPPRFNGTSKVPPAWFCTTWSKDMKLKDVRKKIVLMRRYPTPKTPAYQLGGLDLSSWKDNQSDGDITLPNTSGGSVHYQDLYDKPSIEEKKTAIELFFNRVHGLATSQQGGSAAYEPGTFISFTSAAGSAGGGWTPAYYASEINPWFLEQIKFQPLANPKSRNRGFYLMDFPTQEIIDGIIRWNFANGIVPSGPSGAGNTTSWQNTAHHISSECNTVYIAPGELGAIEVIRDDSYGVVNLRLSGRDGKIILPQKSFICPTDVHDPKKAGEGWVAMDFGGQHSNTPMSDSNSYLSCVFDGYGLFSIEAVGQNGVPPIIAGSSVNKQPVNPSNTPGEHLTWLQTYREGGYGIRDIRMRYEPK